MRSLRSRYTALARSPVGGAPLFCSSVPRRDCERCMITSFITRAKEGCSWIISRGCSRFQVRAHHTLIQTSFRSTGGSQYDKWKHEEHDSSGMLVARYEGWMNTSIRSLATTSEWRKLDPAGNVPTVGQSGI